jgi:hypothetical protein
MIVRQWSFTTSVRVKSLGRRADCKTMTTMVQARVRDGCRIDGNNGPRVLGRIVCVDMRQRARVVISGCF